LAPLPKPLLRALAEVAERHALPIYFSGGVVRDWLVGLPPTDLDMTVPHGALALAADLARALEASFIPLSPSEGVARIVRGDLRLDIGQFREGTTTIEGDLSRRDFTVNAMAVAFDTRGQALAQGGRLIDPTNGRVDLAAGLLRLTHPQALTADPLRMLRAFRFQAVFNWRIEQATEQAIIDQSSLIERVSGERIASELEAIFCCPLSSPTIEAMARVGLLFTLFPELKAGVGLAQPASHHLDVFGHSLETLRQMERVLLNPQAFFPQPADSANGQAALASYLSAPRQRIRLKYAALLHDLGKTITYAKREGRITFYNHDEAGVGLLKGIACRLHWSQEDTRCISQCVKQHMWPFHLHNAKGRTGITPRAILKLAKAAGEDLAGLFCLVMADSLAGQGPGKPAGMEEAVAVLFSEVYQAYQGRLKPMMAQPLLRGQDLIHDLHLSPGPIFKTILDALLEERALSPEMTRDQALRWAQAFAAQLGEQRHPEFRD